MYETFITEQQSNMKFIAIIAQAFRLIINIYRNENKDLG